MTITLQIKKNALHYSRMIGILGALVEEVQYIKQSVKVKKVILHGQTLVYLGSMYGQKIALALTGIGMVNASKVATLLIERYDVRCLLFVGVGGALKKELQLGDIVIAKSLINYDFDLTYFDPTLVRGQFPISRILRFYCNPCLIQQASQAAQKTVTPNINVYLGQIVTGSEFLSPARKKELTPLWNFYHAAVVELEGAGVAQVCYEYKIPFLVIRAISDTFEGNVHEEFDLSLPEVTENLGKIVEEMVRQFAQHTQKSKKKNPIKKKQT